jgi:hypothetical protein
LSDNLVLTELIFRGQQKKPTELSGQLTAADVLRRYKEEDLPAFCEIHLEDVNQVGNFGDRRREAVDLWLSRKGFRNPGPLLHDPAVTSVKHPLKSREL